MINKIIKNEILSPLYINFSLPSNHWVVNFSTLVLHIKNWKYYIKYLYIFLINNISFIYNIKSYKLIIQTRQKNNNYIPIYIFALLDKDIHDVFNRSYPNSKLKNKHSSQTDSSTLSLYPISCMVELNNQNYRWKIEKENSILPALDLFSLISLFNRKNLLNLIPLLKQDFIFT